MIDNIDFILKIRLQHFLVQSFYAYIFHSLIEISIKLYVDFDMLKHFFALHEM